MTMQELELPKGWVKATIGEIVKNKKLIFNNKAP